MSVGLIRVVMRSGKEREIEATVGHSVMETLRDAGVDEILALCGGCCSCATCHVIIDAEYFDRLNCMSDDEEELLDSSDYRTETSRLSCQVKFDRDLDGLRVRVAPED